MNKILVLGGSGLVGSKFVSLNESYFEIVNPGSRELDIKDINSIKSFLTSSKIEAVINVAGFTDVQKAEDEVDMEDGEVYKINALGPKNLAQACKENSIYLVQISTDYVFDGQKSDSPYIEEDLPDPINWYGKTKLFGEEFVKSSGCRYSTIRIEMPFSSSFEKKLDIARIFLSKLQNHEEIIAVNDSDITPTLTDDIAYALRVIIKVKPKGLYHVVSTNSTTPFKFAKLIAQNFGLDEKLIKEISYESYVKEKRARLLKHSWLNSDKFEKEFGKGILHSVEESIELFKKNSVLY